MPKTSNPDPRYRIPQAYQDFLLALEASGRAPDTLRYYAGHLASFLAYLDRHGITDISQINTTGIRHYVTERQKVVSALTVHHDAACIKTWMNHLVREGVLSVSPMRSVKLPKVDARILPSLTPEQAAAILRAAQSPRNKAIILVLLDTGLRASEFVALDVGDVDLGSGAILVRHTKTRHQRMVYVGARTRRALALYLGSRTSGPVWVSEMGLRLSVNGLRMILKRVASATGIPECHAHTFRRTFALWSLRAGMNIYVLQRLMGHHDLTMLQKYLALVEADLETAHREHGAVDTMLR